MSAWDAAAAQCAERIAALPTTKELRDLVYILEHLHNMLGQSGAEKSDPIAVIFAEAGPDEWNE